eukprot:3067000-Rhodomonas_salina.7
MQSALIMSQFVYGRPRMPTPKQLLNRITPHCHVDTLCLTFPSSMTCNPERKIQLSACRAGNNHHAGIPP